MKICVYTICKNEINNIDKWLDCMCEADYMLLVDTGSDDGTYEKLLKEKTTRTNLIVKKINISPFRFDVARNEAMKYIPKDTDICVSMDLDELFMGKGWSKVLKKVWKPIYKLCDLLYIDNKENDFFNKRSALPRTKVHTIDAHWKYPLHEVPVIDDKETYPGEFLTQETHLLIWRTDTSIEGWKNLVIVHNAITNSKSNYINLAKIRCDEYKNIMKNDLIMLIELHNKEKYEECLNYIEKIEKTNYENDDLNEITYNFSNIYFLKGHIYEYHKKDILSAIKYYEKSLETGINHYESMIQLCKLYVATNQKQKILPVIQDVVENWSFPSYSLCIKEYDELQNFVKEELTKYYNLCK